MVNPVIYIILNGELNMSPGKAAAQAVHAVASLHQAGNINEFSSQVKRTVIVLEAKNQHQLENLENYLYELEIPAETYIDEGYNEVDAYSMTALAVGPIAAEDWEGRSIFQEFPLYPAEKEEKKKWYQR